MTAQIHISALGRHGDEATFVPEDAERRIGLILLETDHTTERDFARLTRDTGIGLYANRISYENPTTRETLARTGPRLTDAAARLLPGAGFDAVHFACTSASAVLGDDKVAAAVRAAKPGAAVVNPMSAVCAALHALGARTVSVLTPYTPEVSGAVAERLAEAGFELAGLTCWNLDDDRVMARVRPDVVVSEAIAATADAADALFISCTAVRSAEVVSRIEQAIGRPVVTSNQASAWMCLRLAGFEGAVPDAGRLFDLPCPQRLPGAA